MAAALELIDSGGVEGLSMPKLARHLGVAPMSLYTHIDNKDDLLDGVAQAVLGSLPPAEGASWEDRLRSHFGALRAALVAHPGLGHVLASKNVATPAVLDLLEASLADLVAADLPAVEAVRLYYALLTYTLGFVAWELPRTRGIPADEYGRRWRSAVQATSTSTHPTLHSLVDALTSVATEDQYLDGVDRLIGSARR